MKEKIKLLLGRGLSNSVVAAAVGCTEGYVSQLMAIGEFAEEVTTLRCAKIDEASIRENKLDTLEDKLVEKLEKALPFMLQPNDILRAFAVVNGAKRHIVAGQQLGTQTAGQLVHVNLPAVTLQQFIINGSNEIISVAGRSMATLTPEALKKMTNPRISGDTNAPKETTYNDPNLI